MTLIILFMEMLKFSNQKKKKIPLQKLVDFFFFCVKANKEYFEASKIIYLFIYLFIYLDPEFSKMIKYLIHMC
jgi:hypothetical protein